MTTRLWSLAGMGLLLLGGCGSPPADRNTERAAAGQSTATQTSFDPEMAGVCQGTCAAKIAYQESDVVAQPGANPGNLTRCVVSGVVFQVGNGNPRVDHAGKSYYLCCKGCAGKFRENPGRFVKS
jgi:hypothetical protein